MISCSRIFHISFYSSVQFCRGPVIVHSDSPPSPSITSMFPADIVVVKDRETEFVDAHVYTNPGVEGIEQFGTNTFRIWTWMEAESYPVEVQPQCKNEDAKADTKFENRQEDPSQQPAKDVETDPEFKN